MWETQVRKILWRRELQPTPVFLPQEFHGQRSLVGYCPWGHKELDMSEWITFHFHQGRLLVSWLGNIWRPGWSHRQFSDKRQWWYMSIVFIICFFQVCGTHSTAVSGKHVHGRKWGTSSEKEVKWKSNGLSLWEFFSLFLRLSNRFFKYITYIGFPWWLRW